MKPFQIVYFLLIQNILNDCLPKSALEGLGFTKIKDSAEKVNEAPVCQRVFKEYGSCVDLEEAKDFINNKSKEVAEQFNIKSQIDVIYDLLKENEKDAKVKTQYSDEKKLIDQNYFSCSENMELFNQGALCYLLSGEATQRTVYINNTLTVYIDTEQMWKDLKLCIDVFKGICTAVEFNSTQEKADQCKKYRDAIVCVQTEESCIKKMVDSIVQDINPYELYFIPAKNAIDQQITFIKDSADKLQTVVNDFSSQVKKFQDQIGDLINVISNDIFSRRLNQTIKVKMEANKDGINTQDLGKESGVGIYSLEIILINSILFLINFI